MVARLVSASVLLLGACATPAPDARRPERSDEETMPVLPTDAVRPEWSRAFEAVGGSGVFVLYDPETGQTLRSDAARAAERSLPASTFKVYNALVALETGAVRDPDSVFVWDGVRREVDGWNQDLSLRTSTSESAIWVFQRIAARVGRAGYEAAFAREPYGNAVVGPDLEGFWVDGTLRISPDEQVRFVDGLMDGRLAFRPDVQAAVRGLLVRYEEAGGTLVGKTGWGRRPGEPDVGWLVGWVEREDGRRAVFALRVGPASDTFDMWTARRSVVREILTAEGWLRPAPAAAVAP